MFSFFKSNNLSLEDIVGSLEVDLHSHLIFGIDDGAKTLEDSLELISSLSELGFKKLIMTPHTMLDAYPNTKETITEKFEVLKNEVALKNIPISLEVASEYYLDEGFEKHLNNKPLLINEEYLLFETSYMAKPINMEETIYNIASNGYKPLLAHPERYRYIKNLDNDYNRLKELGVYFQLDTNSMGGFYGKDALKKANYLIDNGMVDFVGSDTHNAKHISNLKSTMNNGKIWKRLFDKNRVLNSSLS